MGRGGGVHNLRHCLLPSYTSETCNFLSEWSDIESNIAI
jgi:hypothetical protein